MALRELPIPRVIVDMAQSISDFPKGLSLKAAAKVAAVLVPVVAIGCGLSRIGTGPNLEGEDAGDESSTTVSTPGVDDGGATIADGETPDSVVNADGSFTPDSDTDGGFMDSSIADAQADVVATCRKDGGNVVLGDGVLKYSTFAYCRTDAGRVELPDGSTTPTTADWQTEVCGFDIPRDCDLGVVTLGNQLKYKDNDNVTDFAEGKPLTTVTAATPLSVAQRSAIATEDAGFVTLDRSNYNLVTKERVLTLDASAATPSMIKIEKK